MAVLVRWESIRGPGDWAQVRYRAVVRRATAADPSSPFELRLHVVSAPDGWTWLVDLSPYLGADVGTGHGKAATPEAAMRAAEDWLEDQPDIGVAPVDPHRRPPQSTAYMPGPPETFAPVDSVTDPSPFRPGGPVHLEGTVADPWLPRALRMRRPRRHREAS